MVSPDIFDAFDLEKQELAKIQREYYLKKMTMNMFKVTRHLKIKNKNKVGKIVKVLK
jgi:hypothetical protein|tara:strand:+ start:45 stop:215 length:171 start_codon:yes stop_codon:yes gene_type:complete